MRPPILRVHGDLIVDNFAGGGGASLGIEWALGRSPDIAVNHDPEAIAMHEANHPETNHLCGDVWDVDPTKVCGGRTVALAWFSPDCKHFSRAKGGKPVEKGVRSLAWVVVRWAKTVRPRVIILENVLEFQTWGALLNTGLPDPKRRGHTFRRWVAQLEAAGYVVEMRELRACDYGAPTTRKRLFVIARCDGRPIVWPTETHGAHRLAYRTAADCIQWEIVCPSIFERSKPLAEKTLRRIGRGVGRYVLDTGDPFIVPVTHAGDDRSHSIREPFRTVTAAHRGELALVAPTLIQTGYGERTGQAPRSLDIREPLGTVVAGGQKHALVSAFLAKHFGGVVGQRIDRPASTITCQDHHALVAASMARAGDVGGDEARRAEVRAFLVKFYGTGAPAPLQLSLDTVTTRDRFGLVMVKGEPHEIVDIGMRMLAPRELFRAQGFEDSYVIDPIVDGKPMTKTAQIRMCGNSVVPLIAKALVEANVDRREVAAA